MPFRQGKDYRPEIHDDLLEEYNDLLLTFLENQTYPKLECRQLLRLVELIDMDELETGQEKLLGPILKAAKTRAAYEAHVKTLRESSPRCVPKAVLKTLEEQRGKYEPGNTRLMYEIRDAIKAHD